MLEYYDTQSHLWLKSAEGRQVKLELENVGKGLTDSVVKPLELMHLYMAFGISG